MSLFSQHSLDFSTISNHWKQLSLLINATRLPLQYLEFVKRCGSVGGLLEKCGHIANYERQQGKLEVVQVTAP
jgi:hypothetical protein